MKGKGSRKDGKHYCGGADADDGCGCCGAGAVMDKLKIDPEFRDKIPAMPKEDFDGLRADILRDGYVRDPLVVWDEENTLLDGHHRWRVICENWETLKDKYTVDRKSFSDRWAAIAWICANQLHKHNMNEIQRAKLIQEENDARQKSHGGDRRSGQFSTDEIHQLKESKGKSTGVRAVIAKEHNISEAAVQTAVEVGRGIDKAATVDPDFKREVLSGEVKARKADLAAIRKLETENEIAEAIADIRNHKKDDRGRNARGWTRADRANRAETEAIVADMLDPTTVPEFTVDLLIDQIRSNSEQWVCSLRNMLTDRSALLTPENRPMIADAIDKYVMNEFMKVRDLLK